MMREKLSPSDKRNNKPGNLIRHKIRRKMMRSEALTTLNEMICSLHEVETENMTSKVAKDVERWKAINYR